MSGRNLFAAAAACAVALAPAAPALAKGKPADAGKKGAGKAERTFEVTIANTTSGQPFSPPYVVTSKKKSALFKVGKYASSALQEVAENGDTALTMRNALVQADKRGTIDAWAGGIPPQTKPQAPAGTPGATGEAAAGPCSPANFACAPTQTITVTASSSASKLSIASMLVCTNDGFLGLAGAKLPRKVGQTLSYDGRAYETGTEAETQNFEDLMPWCQSIVGTFDPDPHKFEGSPFPYSGQVTTNPDLAEGGRVAPHAGIESGLGELGAFPVFDWDGPVATVSVRRVS